MKNIIYYSILSISLSTSVVQANTISTADLTTGTTSGDGVVFKSTNYADLYATSTLSLIVSNLTSFEFNFTSHDRLSDWSSVSYDNGTPVYLGGVQEVGLLLGSTGWTTVTLSPAFSGTINFSVFNADDDNFDSKLSIRNLASPVPIPSSFLLLGSGIVGLFGLKRRIRS